MDPFFVRAIVVEICNPIEACSVLCRKGQVCSANILITTTYFRSTVLVKYAGRELLPLRDGYFID